MQDQFQILLDFFARELISMVIENAPDISVDDPRQVANVAILLLNQQQLTEALAASVRHHLAVESVR